MAEQGQLTRKVCGIRLNTAERAISCDFRRSALIVSSNYHIGNIASVSKETVADRPGFGRDEAPVPGL
jgi:hypothetical protein